MGGGVLPGGNPIPTPSLPLKGSECFRGGLRAYEAQVRTDQSIPTFGSDISWNETRRSRMERSPTTFPPLVTAR